MKYLKSYKLFESNHLLSDTIKDICLDLEDEGFEVINNSAPGSPVQTIRITKCDDDYINIECVFRPSDIKDTLDRIYRVIGNNLINTCLRLYNTHNSYYEIDGYPNHKTYGIELRFYQDGYQHGVNESDTSDVTPAQQEVIDDITNMLAYLADDDYNVSVSMMRSLEDYYQLGGPKLLTVEISATTSTDIMDMDFASDSIIRLYDYMKEHQTEFYKNPSIAFISVPSTRRPGLLKRITVSSLQLDKRNVHSYRRLLNGYIDAKQGFVNVGLPNGIVIQWEQKSIS